MEEAARVLLEGDAKPVAVEMTTLSWKDWLLGQDSNLEPFG